MTEHNWPPTETEIKTVASAALNQSEKNDVKVLVYWENNTVILNKNFISNYHINHIINI